MKHDAKKKIKLLLLLQDSWEIVEGLRGAATSMQEPSKQEGILLKRRKWPMKGWHKVSAPLWPGGAENVFMIKEIT